MVLVSVVSLAIYAIAVVRPLASKPPAFVFVAVPPGSFILVAIILATAWLIARKLAQ
jgi:Na+-translocating ferredoxin:NAD+ oxidoreductase RnfE subunit